MKFVHFSILAMLTVGLFGAPNRVKAMTSPETNIFLPAAVSNVNSLTNLETTLGSKFYSAKWYQDWTTSFENGIAGSFKNHGTLPELTWQPQTSGGGVSYDDVLSGKYDSYLDGFAKSVKSFGSPMRISLAPEMNGDWAAWGISKNTDPNKHKLFWQYVVNRFRNDGVANVSWVWAPNIRYGDAYSYSSLYPGDAYVDYVGLDGYNWGTTQSWGSTWQSFAQVFGPSYNELTKLTGKKVLIMEIGSAEQGGNKAAWITDMFSQIRNNFPQIQGFTWFSENKETDWRIDSSTASRDAFAAGMRGSSQASNTSPTIPTQTGSTAPTTKNPIGNSTKTAPIDGTASGTVPAQPSSGNSSAPIEPSQPAQPSEENQPVEKTPAPKVEKETFRKKLKRVPSYLSAFWRMALQAISR